MRVFIYSLNDLKSGDPFYVGSTNSLEYRLMGHKYAAKREGQSLPLYDFIRENSIDFDIFCLEEVEIIESAGERYKIEESWIKRLTDDGHTLFNVHLMHKGENEPLIDEVKAVKMLADGFSTKEVAKSFKMSLSRMTYQFSLIRRKHSCINACHLVATFFRNNLID